MKVFDHRATALVYKVDENDYLINITDAANEAKAKMELQAVLEEFSIPERVSTVWEDKKPGVYHARTVRKLPRKRRRVVQ